jgi:hypothetical protein
MVGNYPTKLKFPIQKRGEGGADPNKVSLKELEEQNNFAI